MRPTLFLIGLLSAAWPAAAQRPLIVLDPGHGGTQAGVEHDGLLEKDLVLPIAFVFAEAFSRHGYPVAFTRTTDTTIGFGERLAFAEERGAPVLISLHINRNDDPDRQGLEILTAPPGTPNAEWADRVATALGPTGVPVTLRPQESALFRSDHTALVMIELGYLTHPLERRLVLSPEYQRRLARAIVEGIDAHVAGH